MLEVGCCQGKNFYFYEGLEKKVFYQGPEKKVFYQGLEKNVFLPVLFILTGAVGGGAQFVFILCFTAVMKVITR